MCSNCEGPYEGPYPDDDYLDATCEACGHPIDLHEAKYGCDYEADRGDPPRAWRCGCRAVTKLEDRHGINDEEYPL